MIGWPAAAYNHEKWQCIILNGQSIAQASKSKQTNRKLIYIYVYHICIHMYTFVHLRNLGFYFLCINLITFDMYKIESSESKRA